MTMFSVNITARDGAQMELVTHAFENKIPSLAILSMFGVFINLSLYELMAWYAWSLDMINKILGLSSFFEHEIENRNINNRNSFFIFWAY